VVAALDPHLAREGDGISFAPTSKSWWARRFGTRGKPERLGMVPSGVAEAVRK
jgi:hypothetical protein